MEKRHNHMTRNMDQPDCPACEEQRAKLESAAIDAREEQKNGGTLLESKGAAVGKFGKSSGRVIR